MKKLKFILFLIGVLFVFPYFSYAGSSNISPDMRLIYQQIQELKKRIEELENRIKQKEAREEQMRKEIEQVKEASHEIEHIKEKLGNLSLHGGLYLTIRQDQAQI